MNSKDFMQELCTLIGARYPVVYILTWEEDRAEGIIKEVANSINKKVHFWSITDKEEALLSSSLIDFLNEMCRTEENIIFILRDIHPHFDSPYVIRKIRDIIRNFPNSRKTAILLSPIMRIPPELEKCITVIELDLPDYNDLKKSFNDICGRLKNRPDVVINLTEEVKEKLIKAALGLTLFEAENAFAKAICADGVLDFNDIEVVLAEKKQIIKKTGIADYYDVRENEKIENVGGMNEVKKWINKRKECFSEKAKEFGLPQPKGLLLTGIPGCGKSLLAKSIANLWKLPLLRLDVGSIFGKYIGESESNIRKIIKLSETLSPLILWIDEIEKGFSYGGDADGGTSQRVFATLLTWLQEKDKPVFVTATSNDITALPPELFRKGRFDEIFFVDLPSEKDRKAIFEIHLKHHKRNPDEYDLEKVITSSEGFSGAEIEQVVISSLYDAFESGRDVTSEDLLHNIKRTRPLSIMMKDKIDFLRSWAQEHARLA